MNTSKRFTISGYDKGKPYEIDVIDLAAYEKLKRQNTRLRKKNKELKEQLKGICQAAQMPVPGV